MFPLNPSECQYRHKIAAISWSPDFWAKHAETCRGAVSDPPAGREMICLEGFQQVRHFKQVKTVGLPSWQRCSLLATHSNPPGPHLGQCWFMAAILQGWLRCRVFGEGPMTTWVSFRPKTQNPYSWSGRNPFLARAAPTPEDPPPSAPAYTVRQPGCRSRNPLPNAGLPHAGLA